MTQNLSWLFKRKPFWFSKLDYQNWTCIKNLQKFSGRAASIEKTLQVLPIIRLSPNYPNGKILLGKWKSGLYEGRYTGLIQNLYPQNITKTDEKLMNELESMAHSLLPISIRDYLYDVRVQGVLEFDGPPDNLEYICIASIKSLIRLSETELPIDGPWELTWFDLNQIPFEKMPADDRIWYPPVIQGQKICGNFKFGGLHERTIKSYELEEVKELKL